MYDVRHKSTGHKVANSISFRGLLSQFQRFDYNEAFPTITRFFVGLIVNLGPISEMSAGAKRLFNRIYVSCVNDA